MLVDGRAVRVTSPERELLPGLTKRAALDYFLAVGDGILAALRERPVMLERRRDDEVFFQRRLPKGAPEWVTTVRLAEYDAVCPEELAVVAWMVNLGTVTFHPWPVRRGALGRPDQLLIDLDPQAGTGFADAVLVARVLREVLAERALEGFPKTSGSRGMHVIVPIEPRPWREVQALAGGDRARGRHATAGAGDDGAPQARSRRARVRGLRAADRRVGVLGAAGRAGVGAGGVGRAGRGRAGGLRRDDDAGALRARGGPDAVKPMLAKLVADIPPGLYYEPKWDGFRAIVVRDGDSVEILSRNGKPMARYFPDLIAAFRAQLPSRCTVDGEIVVIGGDRLDFFALQQRVHPAASRVDRLAGETPASFIAFDLLDAPDEPFRARRAGLEAMGWAPPLFITPITRDEAVARDWFERFEGAGLDGVIAKDGELPYKPGVRAMFKVKHQRTVDCVVAGYRLHKTEPNAIGSLLLGLHQDGHGPAWGTMFGGLMPIGATSSFPMARRRELLVELRELEIPIADHPWQGAAEHGRDGNRWNPAREQQFVALAPERVIEVAYTHMDGGFFRHPATFVRWRPDRDAASCGFAQLEQPVGFDVGEIL